MASFVIHTSSGGSVRVEPLPGGCGVTVVPDRHKQPDDGSTALLSLTEALALIRAIAWVRA